METSLPSLESTRLRLTFWVEGLKVCDRERSRKGDIRGYRIGATSRCTRHIEGTDTTVRERDITLRSRPELSVVSSVLAEPPLGHINSIASPVAFPVAGVAGSRLVSVTPLESSSKRSTAAAASSIGSLSRETGRARGGVRHLRAGRVLGGSAPARCAARRILTGIICRYGTTVRAIRRAIRRAICRAICCAICCATGCRIGVPAVVPATVSPPVVAPEKSMSSSSELLHALVS